MEGIAELDESLKSITPETQIGEYVFCTVDGNCADYMHLNPLAFFVESEALTLILPVQAAEKAQLAVAACKQTANGLTLFVNNVKLWLDRQKGKYNQPVECWKMK